MMALESTVAVDDQIAIDPAAGEEYLVTTWSDGTQSVAKRAAYSADAWGPATVLRPVSRPQAGRCGCPFPESCSDAAVRR